MDNKIHIGEIIFELLQARHMTKRELGDRIGMSQGSAVYLTKRESIDSQTLWEIGVALKYNFFKHYPIEEETSSMFQVSSFKPEDIKQVGEKKELQEKISELEKQLEAAKRDLVMQKQENAYLKKINDLLEKRK